MKSPVRENRTPGSVRGLSGNWQSYRDPASWRFGFHSLGSFHTVSTVNGPDLTELNIFLSQDATRYPAKA
jgi:hypothetical protein